MQKIDNHVAINTAVCKYDINHRFSLGLQMIGVGGEHGSILAAFLD